MWQPSLKLPSYPGPSKAPMLVRFPKVAPKLQEVLLVSKRLGEEPGVFWALERSCYSDHILVCTPKHGDVKPFHTVNSRLNPTSLETQRAAE